MGWKKYKRPPRRSTDLLREVAMGRGGARVWTGEGVVSGWRRTVDGGRSQLLGGKNFFSGISANSRKNAQRRGFSQGHFADLLRIGRAAKGKISHQARGNTKKGGGAAARNDQGLNPNDELNPNEARPQNETVAAENAGSVSEGADSSRTAGQFGGGENVEKGGEIFFSVSRYKRAYAVRMKVFLHFSGVGNGLPPRSPRHERGRKMPHTKDARGAAGWKGRVQ